jgi:hypothetical protein
VNKFAGKIGVRKRDANKKVRYPFVAIRAGIGEAERPFESFYIYFFKKTI